ncbi:MAG: hypothetical protein FD144_4795 [Rhodospirillaceae bacterium]|nr:MAG: hypothetical protein FD144_4795 [Rhodospirillaceae bacterium]
MPDVFIAATTTANAQPSTRKLLTGAEMRELWSAFEVARDAYSEADEERTLAAVSAAQQRILMARTLDPEGNAIKLKVIAERADCSPGLLGSIIEDLSQPHPAPSLVEFCRAISTAAAPHTEEGGGIKSKAGLADALIPLIGRYTIADAVCAIAMLHIAYTSLGGESGDDPMFATLTLLEDFACGADAADADSAAARSHLIERSQNTDDGWDLGPDNMATATRQARHDLRSMRKGSFSANVFGGTFEAYANRTGWRGDARGDLPVAAE